MFCVNCGAKLEDGAKFCTQCGAQQAMAESAVTEETAAPVTETATEEAGDMEITGLVLFGKTFSKKVVTIAAAAVAAVVLIAILVVALLPGSASPKAAAEEYVKAVLSCDTSDIVDMMPPEALKTICKNNEMSTKEYKQTMGKMMDSLEEDMDDYFGEKRKVSVKVAKPQKMDKSNLRNLQEAYKDSKFGSISDARTVQVKIAVDGNEDNGDGTVTVRVVKQGLRWYIDTRSTSPLSVIYALD